MGRLHFDSILRKLESLSDPKAVEGMARFGIKSVKAYGISVNGLRRIARETGRDHSLAQKLWSTGYLEARILAALIEEPEKVTERQMDRWAEDFDNWAVCDACCSNVFDRTHFAWKKIKEWSRREEEYVKRAAFVLMAALAVHDKRVDDKQFLQFFPIIKREATDERNFVKKAVNWALRQIGKRSLNLNKKAIQAAKEIQQRGSPKARWIASDALRELRSDAVRHRLSKKK
jgi:3-methyladenine DNA glycosylase AlkD